MEPNPLFIDRNSFSRCVKSWRGPNEKLQLFTKTGKNKITVADSGKTKWSDIILPLLQRHTGILKLKAQEHRSTLTKEILTFACSVHSQNYLTLESTSRWLQEPSNRDDSNSNDADQIIEWKIMRPKKICECCNFAYPLQNITNP